MTHSFPRLVPTADSSAPISDTSTNSALTESSHRVAAQIMTCLDEGTVDSVIKLLRHVDQEPALLEILGTRSESLIYLLGQNPSDERTAACLTAVSLLSGHPEQAARWARWWVCITATARRKDLESRLLLALAQWGCGQPLQAAHSFAGLAGTGASVSQTRFGLAMAYLMLGQFDHLAAYQKAIRREDLPLAQLLQILQRSIRSECDQIGTVRQWAVEWCTGRLLWFVGSSIFAPAVAVPTDSDSLRTV